MNYTSRAEEIRIRMAGYFGGAVEKQRERVRGWRGKWMTRRDAASKESNERE